MKILNELPLVAWTILAAKKAACFDEIWVSTDCEKIGAISEKYGAKYHPRDPECAQDKSSSKDAFLEFLTQHKDVWAVGNLQCTFPTQDPNMIKEAVSRITSDYADCVFGVCRSHKFRWEPVDFSKPGHSWTHPHNLNNFRRPRRQDWAGDIVENGKFSTILTTQTV